MELMRDLLWLALVEIVVMTHFISKDFYCF